MGDVLANVRSFFEASAAEMIGLWVAVALTLVVYSYLFADNLLFRLAQHIFVGVAAGYAVIVAWHGVLAPHLRAFLRSPVENLSFAVWLVLGLCLLARLIPKLNWFSKIPVAYLFGVGAALAVGGALSGSIIPQVGALFVSLSPYDWGGGLEGLEKAVYQGILVAGTLGVLLYFYFTTEKGSPLPAFWVKLARFWGGFGRWIILITFGAIFASTVIARVTLLLGRLQFLAGDWLGLIP